MASLRIVASGLAVIVSCSLAYAQAEFFGLGFLCQWKSSGATAVSADGTIVVGGSRIGETFSEAFRWTREEGLVGLGELPGGEYASWPTDVSGDGNVVVGYSQVELGPQAFRWTPEAGMVGLGPPPHESFDSQAFGVSSDGRVVVGQLDERPFMWTPDTDLKLLPGGDGFANAVSPDGRYVVGVRFGAYGLAAMWTDGAAPEMLGDLPGGNPFSAAGAVAADAMAVTGVSEDMIGLRTFLWTRSGGMVALGDIAGCESPSLGGLISDDGRVILARSFWMCGLTGVCRWTRTDGLHQLKSLLLEAGAESVAGWTLEFAGDVSGDGTVIVGTGKDPNGNDQAWYARLPLPCAADLSGDGVLDLADFLAFQQHFALGELAADCDANWTFDLFDYLCFVNAFNQGC